MARPRFHELTVEQQARFGNGAGPGWFPAWARAWITRGASWFFQDASWRHHDFGYVVGGDRWDRARCDGKFLAAMVRDALSQDGAWGWLKIPPALVLSVVFYGAVRIGGQFGSFHYRDQYASLEEIWERENAR